MAVAGNYQLPLVRKTAGQKNIFGPNALSVNDLGPLLSAAPRECNGQLAIMALVPATAAPPLRRRGFQDVPPGPSQGASPSQAP
jgi:hypothetical protein